MRSRADYKAFLENEMRENQKLRLAQEARHGQRHWYAPYLDSLLCKLDYQRVVLAERLARFEIARSILRGAETNLFSTGGCD
jgi:hypothetical protein